MGTSRMGFNLFSKHGILNFIFCIKHPYKIYWKYVWEDTVIPIVCWIIGHDTYMDDGDKACRRCHQYLK